MPRATDDRSTDILPDPVANVRRALTEAGARDTVTVLTDIEDSDQIRVLEVQALPDAAELRLQIVREQLEGDFLAGVADGVIHLAEPAAMNAPADGEPIHGLRVGGVGEFHYGVGPKG